MNVEMGVEMMSVERRAALHAALSDPARLRIADLLVLGDLSPTELQDHLGVSSSLLAHHLNVLEDSGLVSRRRSEADRRRSYVHLLPASVGVLARSSITAARVVFVCTGNSARSQLAAAVWGTRSSVPAASAGTHPATAIEAGAIEAARRHGLALSAQRPRSIEEVLTPEDFVVTVCDTAREELTTPIRVHWSVPDPVPVGTTAAFDAAYDDIARRVDDLAPRLTAA